MLSFAVRRRRTPFFQRSLGKCIGAYKFTVDKFGEDLVFKFVSPFSCSCLQLHEKGEIDKRQDHFLGSGYAGLSESIAPRRTIMGGHVRSKGGQIR